MVEVLAASEQVWLPQRMGDGHCYYGTEGSWHSYGNWLDDSHQGGSHGSKNQQDEGTLESTHYGKKSIQSSLLTWNFIRLDMLLCDPVLRMAVRGNSSHTLQQQMVFIILWHS